MNKKELEAFAKQAAKITVEAVLNAEIEEHLGYALHEKTNKKIAATATPRSPFALKTAK